MVYDISYKILFGPKPLLIRFDEVYGLKISRSKTNDSKYEPIFGKIRYFISKKSVITYIISHNYAKVKINSNDSLTFRKNIDNCIMLLYLLSQLLIMMKIRCFF